MRSELRPIAHIQSDFSGKFGIPRQSGLADTEGKILFEPEFRTMDALKGLEEYSHLWLIWEFSENVREGWKPTVRPPRLGGNQRVGVFSTRSPFRPNPIGLSCVRIKEIRPETPDGPVLVVEGADLLDGTPIYDIKPYLPYADCIPEATGGFTDRVKRYELKVVIPEEWERVIPREQRETLRQILSQDPRPSYQNDPERRYGMAYAGMEVGFTVSEGVLTICEIAKKSEN